MEVRWNNDTDSNPYLGKPVSRKLPPTITAYLQGNTHDLYHRIAAEAGVSVHRLRLTNQTDGSLIPNAKDYTVERTGLKSDSTVLVKDLGEHFLAIHTLSLSLSSTQY